MALDAVWPSPQMDASRMHWPISPISASSAPEPPRVLTRDEPGERLLLANGSDAAGHALAARLVAEERRDAHQHPRKVDRIVHHQHDARAERRLRGADVLEGQPQIELVGPHEAAGGAPEQDRLQRAPSGHAAGELEQLSERRAEGHLVHARALDVTGEAEQLGAGRPLGADPGELRSAAQDHVEHVDERLDVVDHGRLGEQPGDDRERRLVPRLAALALDRVEDRGLLAADVGARALADLDVEREPLAEDVLAEEPAEPRLGERLAEHVVRVGILAAEVDVAVLDVGRVGGDRHRLDQGERIALDDDAVLERAGLGLVGVADQVVRPCGLARHRLPLDAGREGGAAAAEQLRVLDLAEHGVGPDLHRPAKRGVAAVRAIVVEARRPHVADAAQQPQARVSELRDARELRRRWGRPRRGSRAPRRPSTGASTCSLGSTPAIVSIAAGARSHWPRHGLRNQVAPSTSSPSGPTRSSSCAISSCDPWQRQARSSHTCTTRGGRGSTARSA